MVRSSCCWCQAFLARIAERLWLLFVLNGVCLVVFTAAGAHTSTLPSRGSSVERTMDRSARTSPPRPNVVIFLVDTLRADAVGSYGSTTGVTPTMDDLARHGVVFEQAVAPAPWTLPSVVSLMLSQFVPQHRVARDGQKISQNATTLAQRLRGKGYRTVSFFVNPYAGPFSGLDRGFDTCVLKNSVDGAVVSDWIGRHGDGPFFMYIHTIEPHDPFRAPQRYVQGEVSGARRRRLRDLTWRFRRLARADFDAGRPLGTTDNSAEQEQVLSQLDDMRSEIRRLYRASVRQADERMGSVVEALKSADAWSNTLFIMTADHGEEMGEHGMWFHDQSVEEELIHVPLIMRFPGEAVAGRRIGTPVSLVDLGPTILDLLTGSGWESDGRSLMPLIRVDETVDAPRPRVVSVRHNLKKYTEENRKRRGDLNVVVREGRWKGVLNVDIDGFELFDIEKDPHESHDVAMMHRRRSSRLREVATSWLSRYRENLSADRVSKARENEPVKNRPD